MAPADAADPLEMEWAWHLLTVVVRLGRPTAASDLAAFAAISPRIVERMCRIPDSPLCISGSGSVTVSHTAVLSFMRYMGWDFPAPRVSLRPSDVRRWLGHTYVRKRKAMEGGCSSRTRRRLLPPDTDLMDQKQPESLQLTTKKYAHAANVEVHTGIILVKQKRPPTVDAFTTKLTLAPNVSKISIAYAQPRMDQSLRGDDGTVIEKAAPALERAELSDRLFDLNFPFLDAEETKNIHTTTANENGAGDFEEVLFHNCRVEDGGDLEEKPTLPTTIQTVLVRRKNDGVEEDLSLVSKNHGNQINCSTKAADNMETVDTVMIPKQADDIQYNSHNAEYHENAPTPSQEKHPLGASACANIEKKARQTMPQPPTPTDIKVESLVPEMKRNVQPAAFPQEVLFHKCRVEDGDDLEEKPTLPTTSQTVLVTRKNDGVEEDLNLVSKNHGNQINCSTTAADNMVTVNTDMTPKQADAIQYNSHNAEYHENAPTLNQETSPLGGSACANIEKKKARQIMPQPPTPTDTKVESLLPEMKRNVQPAAFPQEVTRCSPSDKRNLNSIENRESVNLDHIEKTGNVMAGNVTKNGQDRKIVKQREKGKKNDGLPKDVKDQRAAKAQKGHVAPKPLPSFEGFLIEEEEGSGGYGTVYRAQRKVDGKIFAIKCPHPNAHPQHVTNERKMLERFGGKNYVIKIDSSFRSGDLECFVLEHVEHDRPEILKKEIDMFQLQIYGYCLFRALAGLHKQGIVHRDVKPGNFLFSRKTMKGYLIDFNLANDLRQKFLKNCKSETISCEKDKLSQCSSNFAPRVHAKEAIVDSKQSLPSKRKRSGGSLVASTPKIDNKSRHGSQAADVSGVTSAKDPTSTKASLDKLKQPMLYKGRKELMNFLNETMQSPNKDTSTAPVSQRKRVAAPLDWELFGVTPMPLRSGGATVAGCGMLNNKGHGKHRREGPCVGTKGFRAPEVLFRSFHQGCKVDVWSAGVTLLYLIIGRAPFGGDPEQNIKEIAKLRGSEELWEVAKLHNRESSYPSELLDIKSLRTVSLREWCAANTRRPEFLKMIPDALFDLLDKCLAVNPRCRLSSDDALMHEFFAPLRDRLRKQRMLTRSVGSDSACSSQVKTLAVKQS